jgi:hypothetical protein
VHEAIPMMNQSLEQPHAAGKSEKAPLGPLSDSGPQERGAATHYVRATSSNQRTRGKRTSQGN